MGFVHVIGMEPSEAEILKLFRKEVFVNNIETILMKVK